MNIFSFYHQEKEWDERNIHLLHDFPKDLTLGQWLLTGRKEKIFNQELSSHYGSLNFPPFLNFVR